MEQFITAERTANAICQDKRFGGYFVLVEGKGDLSLFGKLLDRENAKIIPTFGKYKLREVYQLLSERDFHRKVAIRDADFLRLPGNPKFNPDFSDPIFVTDYHDSELMMVRSRACKNMLDVLLDQVKFSKFENEQGAFVRDIAMERCVPIANLRLANKRFNLGLSFKPVRPEGNIIKYKKFICPRTGKYLGDELMVNTIYEYSKNRGKEVASKELIREKLKMVTMEELPLLEIVNGHDLTEILYILLRDVIGSGNALLQNGQCVGDLLRLSYDKFEFSKTNLYSMLLSWQRSTGVRLLID